MNNFYFVRNQFVCNRFVRNSKEQEEAMSEERSTCQATTKAGAPCKNSAMEGSVYCYVHRHFAAAPANAEPVIKTAAAGTKVVEKADFDMLVGELNSLAEELQNSYPSYTPPEFSPSGMIALIKRNLDKFTPDMQFEIVSELKRNLEGTSPKDLIDPDTWKGMWYILNYTAQAQSSAALEKIVNRLSGLPGMALLTDLKGNLEGTSPKEFLDPETWKGMFLIMNYSARATVGDLKRKLMGSDDE